MRCMAATCSKFGCVRPISPDPNSPRSEAAVPGMIRCSPTRHSPEDWRMLREEQIDIRRQRALEGKFQIEGPAEDEVFGDYEVTNPSTGGQYQVTIRGFEVGDNACTCPDFRTNTLGTCKHIEAVLVLLRAATTPTLWHRNTPV